MRNKYFQLAAITLIGIFLNLSAATQPSNWFGDLTTSDNTAFIDATMYNRGSVVATNPLQAQITKTDAKFLFLTAPGIWSPKWVGSTTNYVRTKNERLTDGDAAFYYTEGGWDEDLEVAIVNGRYYTFVIGRTADDNNDISILETNYLPAQIENVSQDVYIVEENQPVTVSVEFSAIFSTSEYGYLHYTTDNWTSSNLLALAHSTGNIYTATIPGEPSDTEIKYQIRTTRTENPAIEDIDYLSLRVDNNYGGMYGYTSGYTVTCGSQTGVVTSEPPFPLSDGAVTIYFNAEMGNGGLANYEGDVYIHTGLLTSESTNSNDWKYVLTEWGENTPETKMEKIDQNLYQLQINSIADFYQVDAGEEILKVAMVFRSDEPYSGDNYYEGKNADGSDIFVDVYEVELNVKILSPSKRNALAPANQIIPICIEAMENENITLLLNGTEIYVENASSLTYALFPNELNPGNNWLKAVATDGAGNTVADSLTIYMRNEVQIAELPVGMKNGINYIDDNTVTLVLNEPSGSKQFAFAVGEYSGWQPNDQNYMKRTPDGKNYWVTLSNLTAGKEYAYQYLIDGTIKIADPYAHKILDPWNDSYIPSATYPNIKDYPWDSTIGIVSVFQTAQPTYNWQVPDFTPPAVNENQQDLVVYELLIRDFSDTRRIKDVTDSINYLKNMGITAIELMPIMEFDGNNSWGYAPNFFFATDKYYGTTDDYKEFIDVCHQNNIAVILDVVPNHAFGQCPMVQMHFDENAGEHGQPTPQNPWFNQMATHPYSVGYDFNHESPYTRQFFKDVFEHWLTEFNIDGFRVDLSKGLTQNYSGSDIGAWSAYDQSRINIITDYYNHVKSVKPNAYFILEHFADNSEETVLANTGCMLWGNMDSEFKETILGYEANSDFSWAYHANRGWNYPNAVAFMESHDEERQMYEAYNFGNASGDYTVQDTTTALRRMEMAQALLLSVPGPKMLWQFGELGYDYSIMFGGDRTAPKPPHWDYWNNPYRQRIYRVTAAMNDLRKSDAFRFGSFSSDLSGYGKRMWISHESMNLVIVANTGVAEFNIAPSFQHNGTWYEYFSGESINVTDHLGHSVYLAPGDYKVYTSVEIPKPFHYITFTVKDTDTDATLADANVTLAGSGSSTTNNEGVAWHTSEGGNLNYTVSRRGYFSTSGTVQIPETTSETIYMTFNPNAVDNLNQTQINVYPNPAKNQISIDGCQKMQINIYNLLGELIYANTSNTNTLEINTSTWPSGTYLIKTQNARESIIKKIIVQ